MYKNPQLKNPRLYLMIFMDILLFIVAINLSYLLRFDFSLASINFNQIFELMIWMFPLKTIIFFFRGLYKGMWRYTGLQDFWLLVQSCFLSTVISMTIILIGSGFQGHSRGVFIIDGFLTLFLTGGMRLVIRTFYTIRAEQMTNAYASPNTPVTKILIIGAGDAGEKILREIRDNYRLNYNVVGFVDDDLTKQGKTIHGVQVLGTVEHL